ncbi:MAG: hypothetical protein GC137_00075 [Alphaproteobacteria bacterium]|nr:hypothetical protein [Alphaproteobacteria bacterium]
MTKTRNSLNIWVMTEGMAGTENQCLGVSKALGVNPVVKKVSLNQPWKTLTPYLGFEQEKTFSKKLEPPWPHILLTSGRKAIAASRYIKKQNPKTFTVHIQDPRISPKAFDLVCVPHHDPTRGDNVLVTDAAPNMITKESLEKAKAAFPQFGELMTPRIGVLIGGKSKAYDMSVQNTLNIVEQLSSLQASLMVTASRRTGEENKTIIETVLDKPKNYYWKGEGENPYLAILAWSDYLLVTADSASMISECCTTGKPVYMIDLIGGTPRIEALHAHLINKGVLRRFEGRVETYKYTPLNDANMIAEEIKKRLRLTD